MCVRDGVRLSNAAIPGRVAEHASDSGQVAPEKQRLSFPSAFFFVLQWRRPRISDDPGRTLQKGSWEPSGADAAQVCGTQARDRVLS